MSLVLPPRPDVPDGAAGEARRGPGRRRAGPRGSVGTEAAGGAGERGVEGVGAGVCVGMSARGGPVRDRDQREWSEPHGSEAPSEEASGVAIHNPNEILRAKCLTYVNV